MQICFKCGAKYDAPVARCVNPAPTQVMEDGEFVTRAHPCGGTAFLYPAPDAEPVPEPAPEVVTPPPPAEEAKPVEEKWSKRK